MAMRKLDGVCRKHPEHRPEHVGNRPRLVEGAVREQDADPASFLGLGILFHTVELGTSPIGGIERRLEPRFFGPDAKVGQEGFVVHPVECCVFLGMMRGTRPCWEGEEIARFPGNLSFLKAGTAAAADDVVELGGGIRIRVKPLAGNDADEVRAERGAGCRSVRT